METQTHDLVGATADRTSFVVLRRREGGESDRAAQAQSPVIQSEGRSSQERQRQTDATETNHEESEQGPQEAPCEGQAYLEVGPTVAVRRCAYLVV